MVATTLNRTDPSRVSLTAAIVINGICSLVLLTVSIINIYFIFAVNGNVFNTESKAGAFMQQIRGPKKWIAWGLVTACIVLVFTMFWQIMALSHVNMLECKPLGEKKPTI